jgi:hypothetical protein
MPHIDHIFPLHICIIPSYVFVQIEMPAELQSNHAGGLLEELAGLAGYKLFLIQACWLWLGFLCLEHVVWVCMFSSI